MDFSESIAKIKRIFTFFVILVFLSFGFIFISFGYLSKVKVDQDYFVKEGSGISSIAVDLENNGIIESAFKFKVYSKIRSLLFGCNIVQLGEYHLLKNENYNSLLNKFCGGKTTSKTLTIPEGLETREVIELLNNNNDLIGEKIISYDEGIVLPETYSFKSGVNRNILFLKMQQDLANFIKYEWEKREKNDLIRSPKDAIILASIVEKEAKTDKERPIIASVYINRLRFNMRLQACPTAIYEITKGEYKLSRPLTRKDTKIVGDYNTYRKRGLPITPICNPGKKSILAVLHPAKTNYLYFVVNTDLNEHIFTDNYKDHLKNIKQVKLKRK